MVKPSRTLLSRLLHIASCAALIALPAYGETAQVPDGIPATLISQLQAARHDWTMEAQLVHAKYTRKDASQPFDSDVSFLAASRPKLYHVKDGTNGHTADEEQFNYLPVLTAKIIDVPQAVEAARKSRMKGQVLNAELMAWAPYGSNVVVEVWRLVPDNDPDTADPNNPNMKNYYIDALTGISYPATDADQKALEQGRDAMSKAIGEDMSEFAKSLQH